MKVKELIRLLQEFPQDLPILIPGYEGGADSISSVSLTRFLPNYFIDQCDMGQHAVEILDGSDYDFTKDAVLLL